MDYDHKLAKRAMDAVDHGILLTDTAGIIIAANPALCRLTGYELSELLGSTPSLLNSGTQPREYFNRLWETISSGKTWHEEIQNRRKDGTHYFALQVISPVTDEGGAIRHYVAIQYDISERRSMEQHLRYLSEMDSLTGIANRRKTMEELEREIARFQRHRHEVSILMLDIDHFKQINDNHGHEAGDTVLRCVTALAEATLRPSDRIGRWGGEEFIIILPDTPAEGARKLAERLRATVESGRFIAQRTITVSIGTATLPDDEAVAETLPAAAEALIRQADARLYRAKEMGRNTVCSSEEDS